VLGQPKKTGSFVDCVLDGVHSKVDGSPPRHQVNPRTKLTAQILHRRCLRPNRSIRRSYPNSNLCRLRLHRMSTLSLSLSLCLPPPSFLPFIVHAQRTVPPLSKSLFSGIWNTANQVVCHKSSPRSKVRTARMIGIDQLELDAHARGAVAVWPVRGC
jgi:hypothetical protein